MQRDPADLMLITGATGLVGSHVAERARRDGWRVRALVRSEQGTELLRDLGVELSIGDMADPASLAAAVAGATVIVHCAAKVGDWGPIDGYRAVNVHGLQALLRAAEQGGALQRFVHISSLGVYPARDHYGTDEGEPPDSTGIDGYTRTKVEAEQLVLDHAAQVKLPAVVLRPGFIYGPRDRTVLPKLMERLRSGKFAYLGTPEKLMNNTFIGNLVDAVFLSLDCDAAVGRVYNITDGRLVTKKEFMETIVRTANYPTPSLVIPLTAARTLARVLEGLYRLLGKREAPLLSSARIKFLGLNLDYCIDRARRELRYEPQTDFAEAMPRTVQWFLAARSR